MVSRYESLVGRRIGRYRVESWIGEGGFATVWRARHERLDRVAALKVLHSKFDDQPVMGKRFVREGRIQAALSHPSIVDVYDAGEEDGLRFIALRLIEGAPLVRRGRLSVGVAASVLGQVAAGLDAAHTQGVVHRDVNPNNILLEGSGDAVKAYVTDFGIVAIAEGTMYTLDGSVLGTPSYMSPEELKGEDVTARSDVFSLGCVAFFALTGRDPFRGAVAAAVLLQTLEANPKLSDDDQNLRHLDDVVAKAMEKDPKDRYGTCQEFVDALRKAAVGNGGVREGSDPTNRQVEQVIGPTKLDGGPIDAVLTVADELARHGRQAPEEGEQELREIRGMGTEPQDLEAKVEDSEKHLQGTAQRLVEEVSSLGFTPDAAEMLVNAASLASSYPENFIEFALGSRPGRVADIVGRKQITIDGNNLKSDARVIQRLWTHLGESRDVERADLHVVGGAVNLGSRGKGFSPVKGESILIPENDQNLWNGWNFVAVFLCSFPYRNGDELAVIKILRGTIDLSVLVSRVRVKVIDYPQFKPYLGQPSKIPVEQIGQVDMLKLPSTGSIDKLDCVRLQGFKGKRPSGICMLVSE